MKTNCDKFSRSRYARPTTGGSVLTGSSTLEAMPTTSCPRFFGQPTLSREPDVNQNYLRKRQHKPLRSPLIVMVVTRLTESRKIPEIEQMLSAGSAAHSILLASRALGFGSIWLTGNNACDDIVVGVYRFSIARSKSIQL